MKFKTQNSFLHFLFAFYNYDYKNEGEKFSKSLIQLISAGKKVTDILTKGQRDIQAMYDTRELQSKSFQEEAAKGAPWKKLAVIGNVLLVPSPTSWSISSSSSSSPSASHRNRAYDART